MIVTTKPIPLEVVQAIKQHIRNDYRALAWFSLSINSAFRGGDILKIQKDNLIWKGDRLEITIREDKTEKIRIVLLNAETSAIVQQWISVHPCRTNYLFEGIRGKMGTAYWSVLLREWCNAVGYEEPRTATHSLRKTFVKEHYLKGTKLATLMHVLNHSTERQVLTYCGIMAEDVDSVYQVAL